MTDDDPVTFHFVPSSLSTINTLLYDQKPVKVTTIPSTSAV